MTRAQFKAAFKAWCLAVEEKIEKPDAFKSYEDLAKQYGKSITNPDDLDEVAEVFDWDNLISQVEALKDA